MSTRSDRNQGRLMALLGCCLVSMALSVQSATTAAKETPTTTRISISSGGGQANNASYAVAITPDGRYVAFTSEATNLVSGDTNGRADAFVHDRQTGETTRVSVSDTGQEAEASDDPNGYSAAEGITPDGRYVAFRSDAPNLVSGKNKKFNVFVRDRVSARTSRVSVSSTGRAANALSQFGSISSNGRYVVFDSWASNLVPGDTNRTSDIFVHDRRNGRTARVSISSRGRQGNRSSAGAAISADGGYVAFASAASNLVPGDANKASDVFVHDRRTGRTARVSISSTGRQGNRSSTGAAISADGRYVTFVSEASKLVRKDTNRTWDVFVRDRVIQRTRRVSVSSRGAQANRISGGPPSISPDGRYAAFESLASNLAAGDRNKNMDVFVHDRKAGYTILASLGVRGNQGNTWSSIGVGSALSANGRDVVFSSPAPNLVPRDTNGAPDVFVRDFGGRPAP